MFSKTLMRFYKSWQILNLLECKSETSLDSKSASKSHQGLPGHSKIFDEFLGLSSED
ncbi:hypothetical protein [uncultured Helicobacter sp.]|uniref:hypothetical protein n=1 Tax=uncultured Helicobacter sp. TaxID=175537 RepID=UPI00374F865F